ncbi:unnamed protein product [Dovyalis caffra]|uniref:MLO-like protein n=1 Tax=Dovyalis caffra TaxID=77055 RepID=A0AAV1RZ44_9ROSI|nr:unnamed protein product [Dovyalis caffra]
MSGGGEGETLEYTPTWVVAAVCTVIVAISLAVERLLHYCGNLLRRKNQKPLYEALQKVKEELMLLGFISLLLTVSQNFISKICVPEHVVNNLLPCSLSEKQKEKGHGSNSTTTTTTTTEHFQSFFTGSISGTVRRLLAETSESHLGYCANKGKVPLLSLEAIHHLHIFIFVLAIVHVTFCVLTILFGGARIHQWKHWENEIAKDRYDTQQGWTQGSLICASGGGVDFYKPSNKVACSECGGLSVFIALLLDVEHRSLLLLAIVSLETAAFFYLIIIDFHLECNAIRVVLLLAVGTKLEHVITQLAYDVAEKHIAIEGELVVQPSDDHFWVEAADVFSFGILLFIQVLCSYSTLPLYAIVSQMGSSFKKAIFEDGVQAGLVGWAEKVKKKKGLKGATEGSSEASSHVVSAGELQLGRLKGLKTANEGSSQASSHDGSTVGNNASASVPRVAEP